MNKTFEGVIDTIQPFTMSLHRPQSTDSRHLPPPSVWRFVRLRNVANAS